MKEKQEDQPANLHFFIPSAPQTQIPARPPHTIIYPNKW
jgi:hypothetical protein